MQITRTSMDGVDVLSLSTDITLDNAQSVKAAIIDIIEPKDSKGSVKVDYILLDLQNVSIIDSSGVGVFLVLYNKTRQLNIPMAIFSPSLKIIELLKILRVDSFIDIIKDIKQAILQVKDPSLGYKIEG